MSDVSIILPSIRSHNIEKVYNSFERACKEHTFDVIICSPYKVPDNLLKKPNVTYIHSYCHPTACYQIMGALAKSEFIFNMSDDCLMYDDGMDNAIKKFRSLNLREIDVINMTYAEGLLDYRDLSDVPPSATYPSEPAQGYWYAHHHPPLRLPGIKADWKIFLNFLMKTNYFRHLGGFDCRLEFLSYSILDLAFRCQAHGSTIVDTDKLAFRCAHVPGYGDDHGPVMDSQFGGDINLFNDIYSTEDAAYNRMCLDYNNWTDNAQVWNKRFKDLNNLPVER